MKRLKSGLLAMLLTFLYSPYCYALDMESYQFKADIGPLDAAVQALCKGKEVVIKRGAKSDAVGLRKYSRTQADEKCKILYQIPTEKMVAVVLDVTGSSREPQYQGVGHCGAGDEAAIIWIGISKHSNTYNVHSFPYSSCIYDISADEIQQDSTGLRVNVTDFHDDKVRKMRFVKDKPTRRDAHASMHVQPRSVFNRLL